MWMRNNTKDVVKIIKREMDYFEIIPSTFFKNTVCDCQKIIGLPKKNNYGKLTALHFCIAV
jgi:hypothetical protein